MCPLDWTIRFKIMIRRLFKSDNADRVKKTTFINKLKMVKRDLLMLSAKIYNDTYKGT